MGAQVTLVDGLISDCGRIVAERKAAEGWFHVSTLKEPYRIEGKKTMGYELATNSIFVAGYIKLTRPAPYDNALLIPKGTELSTTIPASATEVAFTSLYETSYATQFDPGDAEIWIPVSAKNRTSPTNTIKEFGAGPTRPGGLPADLSVTNAASAGDRGAVTISRVTATSALTIPAYTVVRSTSVSSPNQSYQHILPAEIVMPVGMTNITVPVWRRTREIPNNQTLSFTAGNPGGIAVSATSIDGLMDWNDTGPRRSPTFHGISSWFKVRALDGSYIAANGLNTFIDSMSGIGHLSRQVRNGWELDSGCVSRTS